MTDLVDRIHTIIEAHRPAAAGSAGCRCGAAEVNDYPRHLAKEIARGLKLRRERIDDADSELNRRVRYASAWFDDELTRFEGAE